MPGANCPSPRNQLNRTTLTTEIYFSHILSSTLPPPPLQVTLKEECVMDVSDDDLLSLDAEAVVGECPGGVCAFPDLVGQFIRNLEEVETLAPLPAGQEISKRQVEEEEDDKMDRENDEYLRDCLENGNCPGQPKLKIVASIGELRMNKKKKRPVKFDKGVQIGNEDSAHLKDDDSDDVTLLQEAMASGELSELPAHRYNFSGPAVPPSCLWDCEGAREEEVCRETSHRVRCEDRDRVVAEAVMRERCETMHVEEDAEEEEECTFREEEVCDDDNDNDEEDEEDDCEVRVAPQCKIVKQRVCQGFVPSVGIDDRRRAEESSPFQVTNKHH